METIGVLLVLFSIGFFIVGMIKPQIAAKIKIKPHRGVIFIICLIAFIVGACMLPDAEESETASSISTSKEEKQETKKQQEEETGVGNEITIDYFAYTVNGFKFKKTVGSEYSRVTADGIYLEVDLSIKNISKETRTVTASMFYVTDKDGLKYEDSDDAIFSSDNRLISKECQPKIPTKGTVLFEVPEKGEYYLHLRGDYWGGDYVKILLK